MTMCGWVNMDSIGGTLTSHYENNDNRFQFSISGTGYLQFYYKQNTNIDINVISTTAAATGSWYHCALVRIGEETGLYLNGAQVGYDATFTPDTFTGSLRLGQRGDNDNYIDGKMDDWAIVYSNIFGAAPNSTPDDTFTVDTLKPLGLVI